MLRCARSALRSTRGAPQDDDMTQFATAEDGVRIAYETAGEGKSIILAHGFASDRMQNWKNVGWYETLNGAGFRVVALDFLLA